MRHFPLFVHTDGKRIVIVGGGEEAAQKYRLLSRTDANISLMAPTLTEELAAAVAGNRARHIDAVLAPSAFSNTRLVVVSTGCAALDAVAADLARQAGALVNVVDRPALSDVIMPAIVDRDPVVVAIGTEGTAPVLARQIKTRLEGMLEPTLGQFAARLGALRPRIAQRIAPKDRRRFWEWLVGGPRRRFTAGDEATAIAEIHASLESGRTGAPAPVAVIGLTDPDLMTLRAVQRLQSADLVLHEPEAQRDLLDLARRDSQREVLARSGPTSWTVERTARRAISAQDGGAQVVWITGAPDAALAALRRLGTKGEEIPVGAGPSGVVARAEDG